MTDGRRFFEQCWRGYVEVAPSVELVAADVRQRFGPITNDHVAFRTFDRAGFHREEIEDGLLGLGYQRREEYQFPDKHLDAAGYTPSDPEMPLVFLSQLRIAELSTDNRQCLERLLRTVKLPEEPLERLLAGRRWPLPSKSEYLRLEAESPYAAWLSVWGLRANHFTVAVHALEGNPELRDLVDHLKEKGHAMSAVGGELKGSAEQLLEQASTLADPRDVPLGAEGPTSVRSCYYEFARRYPDASGQLYQGFVAASASNIFESTT